MGTQKLYLAFGLFVITYYHCFKIPTFSLWKYCFLWNPPCRAECFLQHRRYFEESLFCDSSILNTLWMKNLENQCSTLRKYSCSAQGAIIFFLNFRFIKNNKRNCDIHSDVRLLTLMTMLFFFYLPLSKIAYINVLPGDHISNNKACVTYSSVTQCCNWEI